jgi:hypothetical protein
MQWHPCLCREGGVAEVAGANPAAHDLLAERESATIGGYYWGGARYLHLESSNSIPASCSTCNKVCQKCGKSFVGFSLTPQAAISPHETQVLPHDVFRRLIPREFALSPCSLSSRHREFPTLEGIPTANLTESDFSLPSPEQNPMPLPLADCRSRTTAIVGDGRVPWVP